MGGGLLLLSRHRIVASAASVYRQCSGMTACLTKGCCTRGSQRRGSPSPVDVFLTHTQAGAPDGRRDDGRRPGRGSGADPAPGGVRPGQPRPSGARRALFGDLNVDAVRAPGPVRVPDERARPSPGPWRRHGPGGRASAPRGPASPTTGTSPPSTTTIRPGHPTTRSGSVPRPSASTTSSASLAPCTCSMSTGPGWSFSSGKPAATSPTTTGCRSESTRRRQLFPAHSPRSEVSA